MMKWVRGGENALRPCGATSPAAAEEARGLDYAPDEDAVARAFF